MQAGRIRRTATVTLVLAFMMGGFPAADHPELGRLKGRDNKMSFDFKDAQLSKVLDLVSKAGSFKLTLGGSFKEVHVTAKADDATVASFLGALADDWGLVYTVPGENELVVESRAKE